MRHPIRIGSLAIELQKIPGACRQLVPPATPPVFGSRRVTPSPPERVEVDPAFDDTDFRVQDSGAMEEALNSARRLVQPDDGTAMKRGGHDWGIEALAWYCSFHDYYHRDYCDRWGIYVPLSSLHLMDELCLSDLPISRARRW